MFSSGHHDSCVSCLHFGCLITVILVEPVNPFHSNVKCLWGCVLFFKDSFSLQGNFPELLPFPSRKVKKFMGWSATLFIIIKFCHGNC